MNYVVSAILLIAAILDSLSGNYENAINLAIGAYGWLRYAMIFTELDRRDFLNGE